MEEKKIKLIYCMGAGRSGSTLLNIILGNHPKIIAPGEITYLERLPEDNFKCSCDETVANCSFWSKVLEKWQGKVGGSSAHETIARLRKIENFKNPFSWLNAVYYTRSKSKKIDVYINHTYEFLKAIVAESGKNIVADISKNPIRPLLLMKHPNIDLRLVHLTRDGRGVAWSVNKGIRNRSIWRAAIFWLLVNRQSDYVRKKALKKTFIKYEDLVLKPEYTLSKIAELADIDPKPLIESLTSNLAQKDSHIMAGNKLRWQKQITLKLDTEWPTKMSKRKQKLFLIIAGRLMNRYGYLSSNTSYSQTPN